MASTETGVHYPSGTDEFAPHIDDQEQAESLNGRIIAPVANVTDRNALAAALAPSASEPLFVKRADSAGFEYTTNGTKWHAVGGIERFSATSAGAGSAISGSALYQTANLAAAPYDRLVIAWAALYGTPAPSSVWDGALSIAASTVDDAQTFARFTAGSSGTVFMQYQDVVPANVLPLVRTWHRYVSGGTLARSAAVQFSYIRGITIAL